MASTFGISVLQRKPLHLQHAPGWPCSRMWALSLLLLSASYSTITFSVNIATPPAVSEDPADGTLSRRPRGRVKPRRRTSRQEPAVSVETLGFDQFRELI